MESVCTSGILLAYKLSVSAGTYTVHCSVLAIPNSLPDLQNNNPMHFPRPLIHITKLDFYGVEYTAAVEDIPSKPTREEMWQAWRESKKGTSWDTGPVDSKGHHGTLPVTAIELYNELELLKHQ